ncbi:MAG: cyclase family protein [bacterium]|nr:cyclase family protein [bacterium]
MTATSHDSGGVPSEGELGALFEEVKNWGRWGWDDEKGTLNHVTPAHTLRAISLVRTGRVVSTAFDLDTERSAKNYFPTVHRMLFKGFDRPATAVDQVTIVPHSFTVTHIDAVSHSNYGGVLYNGRAAEAVVQRTGLQSGSVLAAKDGIVTRGVLLDVPASLGRDWLEPDEYITEADLDAAAEWAGLDVGAGDVVLVRSGLGAREAASGVEDINRRAGLSPACVRWLRRRDVAVYGGDCFERLPLPYTEHPWAFHQIAQASVGLILLDNVDLEALAAVCAEESRWEFLYIISPLRLPGGTGSAVNPLAVF